MKRCVFQIVIKALQSQYVSICLNEGIQNGSDLRILAAQDIAQQQAGAFAGKFGVEGGNAQGFSVQGRGTCKQD